MEQQPIIEQALTIQQMAQATGLSAHTLRYYERAGLMLQPVKRKEASGYRSYRLQDVAWIELLKHLRATGMPIRTLQRYAQLLRQGEQTIPERLQLLNQHQNRVEAQLQEVQHHLEVITRKIASYEHLVSYEHHLTQHQPGADTESPPSRSDA